MKFFYYLLLLVILIEIIWVVLGSGNFEDTNLKYLTQKLDPTECMNLLQNIYTKKPITDEEYPQLEKKKIPFGDEPLPERKRETPLLTPEKCRFKLEEWLHNLPGGSESKWAWVALANALRNLGRPDLAQYVKRSRKVVQEFEEDGGNSRSSRNTDKGHKISHPGIAKKIQANPLDRKFKDSPQEAVLPVYRGPAATKALRGKSFLEKKGEMEGAHTAGSERIEGDDSRTRWTAFLILLGIIALTILATVFFALYKKNGATFFKIGKKICEDRYPLADRFGKKPPTPDIDVEQGSSTSCSPCGRKKKRAFSTETSPSSFLAKERKILIRRPKKKKFVKAKLDKRCANKCDKTCTGIVEKERGPASLLKIDKATRTRNKKCCEKSQCTEPPKPRIDLKTFHEKIANILRKDDNSCKCCKCNAFSEDNQCICLNQTKKNMCADDKCHQFKLKSIAELCLSSDELSPTKPGEDNLNKKKKKKRKKEKDYDKDTDTEKGCCEKSCTENSARSKDKKELKIKEKKMKKKKSNAEDECSKKTCLFKKSAFEKNSHMDKGF